MSQKNIVATCVAVAVLLCVGLIYFSGQEALRYLGPSKLLARPDGSLYVLSHGKIHHFDPSGKRQGVVNLRDFGRDLTPSDLAVYGDGRFLVGEASEPAIYRCDPRSGLCEKFKLEIGIFGHIPGNSLKFYLDEQAGRIFISDNAAHRVLVTDLDGRQLSDTKSSETRFWFPNQLWRESGNRLFVVNTNYKKIVAVSIADDQIGKEEWALPTHAGDFARPGRVWPFAAVRLRDESWWVLNARDGMKDADLIHFRHDGTPDQRVDLGEKSDPFGILLWNGRLLVAEAIQYRIQSVDSAGMVGADFGDEMFRRELAQAKVLPDRWKLARLAAQFGVVIFPLLGIVLLWRLGEPLNPPSLKRLQSPVNVMPRSIQRGEIAWIVKSATVLRRQRWTTAGMLLFVFVTLPLIVYLSSKAGSKSEVMIWRISLIGILGIVLLMQTVRDFMQSPAIGYPRLGCDGERVFYEPNSTRRSSVAISDVLVDRDSMLIGSVRVRLRNPAFGDHYLRSDLEEVILARLPSTAFVSNFRFEWASLRAGNMWAWLLMVALVVVLLFRLARDSTS